MLNISKKEISQPLTLIIKQMLDSGICPMRLKISKIFPLYEKGDVNYLNNYRPIFKICEWILYDQLYTYFDNNNISEQQCGFRTEHSAELAAVKLVDYIHPIT